MGAVISSSEDEEEIQSQDEDVFEEEQEEVGEEQPQESEEENIEEDTSDSLSSDSDSTSSDDSSFFGDSSEDTESPDEEQDFDFEIEEGILFGMGNPLLDISTNVAEGYLEKYGMLLNSAILAEKKHLPMYKELVEMFQVEYIAGGATQNSIKVAQWMLGLPRATTFIGCIGKDKFGEILKAKAREVGVHTSYYEQDEQATGTCAALLCGINRSLCANLAAANVYKKEHLDMKENWALVEKAKFYYIAGFFLTVSLESILAVAKHAADNGKIFSMNLSAPFLAQFYKDQQTAALPYVDIIFGNETEAATFAEVHEYGTKDVKEIAQKIAAWTKINSTRHRIVVITQGNLPTVVANGPHEVTEYPIIPLAEDKIVDTNGAGDAFVGGYLAQLVKGKSIKECVNGGNYASNLIIQRSGCTTPEKCAFE